MPYAAGVYGAPSNSWNPAVAGSAINATDWAALLADLTTALSTAVLKDGSQTITANIPMSTFKLTGLAAGTAAGDSARYEQTVQAKIGTFTYDLTTASGTQNVTGLGITPTQVFIMGGVASTTAVSFGLDDGTTHLSTFNDYQDAANTWAVITSDSICCVTAVGNNFQKGHITALASGQFTITWVKTGSPTGTATFAYLALGR